MIQKYVQNKSALGESVETLEKEIEQLKATKKITDKHIKFSRLPEKDKFLNLKKGGKQFMDTIKMIAYRAETAMATIVRELWRKKTKHGR